MGDVVSPMLWLFLSALLHMLFVVLQDLDLPTVHTLASRNDAIVSDGPPPPLLFSLYAPERVETAVYWCST
jgi:hypothetical protein